MLDVCRFDVTLFLNKNNEAQKCCKIRIIKGQFWAFIQLIFSELW